MRIEPEIVFVYWLANKEPKKILLKATKTADVLKIISLNHFFPNFSGGRYHWSLGKN